MTKTETNNWIEKVGKPAYDAIAEMVAAAQVDYERLQELLDRQEADRLDDADTEELNKLIAAAGDCTSEEDAWQRIDEDPLEIEVGGWWSQGFKPEASEYRILLTTGGPAVRIVGGLDDGQPRTAALEVQDWGKPWTEFRTDREGEEVLLTYARRFYFGD